MNPATVLTFLFAFSWFGITGDHGLAGGLMVVLGVFLGTYFWWGAVMGNFFRECLEGHHGERSRCCPEL